MKKLWGVFAFFVAIGMILMMVISNRLIGLVLIALFLLVGYLCCREK